MTIHDSINEINKLLGDWQAELWQILYGEPEPEPLTQVLVSTLTRAAVILVKIVFVVTLLPPIALVTALIVLSIKTVKAVIAYFEEE